MLLTVLYRRLEEYARIGEKLMKIIISPAKKMEECDEIFDAGNFPVYMEKTEILYRKLKSMTEGELQALLKANDSITHENFKRYQSMDLYRAVTPALLAYVGIQYQYMAPKLFSCGQWEYVKSHLRILSGFYGILRPDDRITPYRLEMQAKLSAGQKKDLYDFWGSSLLDEIRREETGSPVILNLASEEYSKAIKVHLTDGIRFVTCVFGVMGENGKIKVKATEAKMARGEMVRFMAENQVEDAEKIREFSALGYRYSEKDSGRNNFVYLKEKNEKGKEEE